MKRFLLFSVVLVLSGVLIATWNESRRPQPVELTPTLTGQPEYCLTCHQELAEISPSHPVETFGCVLCHGGERLALDADLAHSSMRNAQNPADLAAVEASCGGSNCHSGETINERDHIQRVKSSLQATYAGAIANIRYTFGAQPDLGAVLAIKSVLAGEPERPAIGLADSSPKMLAAFEPLSETSPSVLAFAQNCLNCHLWASPAGEAPEYARLTGCAACHTPTAGLDLNSGDADRSLIHQVTTAIPYTQCNTCHNRGNYDLRQVQFKARQDQPADRLNDYYQPIAQFTRCEYELDCVDCHTRQEVMGDGHLYNSQKDAQYTQCRTCHGTLEELPKTNMVTHNEDIALRLAFLNPVIDLKIGDTIVTTEAGEPLWNIRRLDDGTFELFAKVSGARYEVPLVKGSACEQKIDEQESHYCHTCHAVQR